MTHTMQPPDQSEIEATRSREVTYWVDERDGLFPLPWWKMLPLVIGLGAITVALLTLIMVQIYQRQIVSNAEAELDAAGIDPSTFSFDASYRDLEISGVLPEGVTLDQIRSAAEETDGLRDLDLGFSAPQVIADPEPEPEPMIEAEPEVVATATTTVDAQIVDGQITLTGEVPSEADRDLLVAFAGRNGLTVVDELTVADAVPATPGAGARVLQLATLLGSLPGDTVGSASLTDESLTSEFTVTDPDAEAAINGVISRAVTAFPDGSAPTADVTVEAPPVEEEIVDLQEQFDDLAIEIRENVTFQTGSDVLNDTAAETLDKVVALMSEFTAPVVRISGHTDDQGPDDANLALSDARAAAVRQYLIDAGIDGDRIESIGLGETDPIASNDTAEGRAQNRRVELVALESFDS